MWIIVTGDRGTRKELTSKTEATLCVMDPKEQSKEVFMVLMNVICIYEAYRIG